MSSEEVEQLKLQIISLSTEINKIQKEYDDYKKHISETYIYNDSKRKYYEKNKEKIIKNVMERQKQKKQNTQS